MEDSGELTEDDRSAVLRALHTLKGNSGMLGQTRMVETVHSIETVLKDPPARWAREDLDALFEAAAALRRAVDRIGTEGEEEAIAQLRQVRLARPEAPGSGRTEAGDEDDRADKGGTDSSPGEREPRRPPRAAGRRSPQRKEELGEEQDHPQELEPRETADAESTTERPEDAVGEIGGVGEIVRVPFSSLDTLLNRVGELVTLGARVEDLLDRYSAELETGGARRPLEDAAEGLARLTAALHETTMELRLVPIRRVFERFPRLVRDLAKAEGKRVRVELEGEDVRLDKRMADAIADPLLHLVRNAVDHGIEPPAERQAKGRPATGTVALRARRAGDRIRIEVEDDGAGLDRAGILARARAMRLIGSEETADTAQAAELILRPGFSTRAKPTTVSGRGVGLDVVRRRVAGLRGLLTVESRPEGGTRFVLDLPLTLAIIPAVLFESAGEILALPAIEVEETIREISVERAGGAEVVRHRDELVSVARPARLFGWNGAGEAAHPFAIVVRRGERAVAVLAERLIDQREVVVKALPTYLGAVPGVSGVALTPEGRVVLLLDAGGVLNMNIDSHRRGKVDG